MNPDSKGQLLFFSGYKKFLHVALNTEWRRAGFRLRRYLLSLKTSEPQNLTGILLKTYVGKKTPEFVSVRDGKKKEANGKSSKLQILPSDFVGLFRSNFDQTYVLWDIVV